MIYIHKERVKLRVYIREKGVAYDIAGLTSSRSSFLRSEKAEAGSSATGSAGGGHDAGSTT